MKAATLLEDLRVLYRRHPGGNAPGEYRRAADAYKAALAAMPQIPERQRKNVYDHTLYGNVRLQDAIDSAIHRETTRTVRVDQDGLRVESVQEPGDGEHFRVEMYDTATGELIATANGLPAAWVRQTATDLFAEVWNHRQADEQPCDGCYVRPDGTHDDDTRCPCSVRPPAGGCRCQPSPAEWHGPAYVRAEIAASEV